ncbi:MAG: hypothetical protein IJ811_04090, partial [Clostridia bacterium]|nr:hypothetical protein [Clostridia bacterium]
QKINLEYDETVIQLLLDEGYSKEYGVRPLERAVNDILADSLSEKMLRGEVVAGDTVRVYLTDDDLIDFKVLR